jgi:prefoldin subunit 5
MPTKLPDQMKSLVIQQWLQGVARDTISANNGLSAGAVTNIVNEWRHALGHPIADELRDLAITLKKVGISPAQCAMGFRVSMLMSKLGVKEDNFESFMLEVYNRCNDIGLSPESIASLLEDLLEFSKSSVVPLSQIPAYIEQKSDEKEKLEQEIEKLNDQIGILQMEKSDFESLRDYAIQDHKITKAELKWYSDLKAELRKYGIPVDDISNLARGFNGIRQYGYDPKTVINEFSDLNLLKSEYKTYQGGIYSLKQQYSSLNQECSSLQEIVNSYKQTLSVYSQLTAMGFGLKDLKLLWHTINEIADANNIIPPEEAVQKFFKDIDEQYDDKLGFEAKVDNLRVEVSRLNQEQGRLRTELLLHPLIGPALLRLIQSGLKEEHIIAMAELLEKDRSGGSISGGSTIEEIRLLIAELHKYGGIKSTMCQLNQQADKLRKEVSSLREEKQDLDTDNQKIFSALLYSKQIVNFLSGSAVSLRNEITGLLSIIANIMYLLNIIQFEGVQKSEDNKHLEDKFVPLIRAARSEPVEISKLKFAVVKAIEVMLEKLNSGNDKVLDILSKARLALINEQQL